MNIIISKAKANKRTFLVWGVLAFIMLIAFYIMHLGFYFLISSDEKTLAEHFSGFWFNLIFYSLIFPASIAFSYLPKQITVNHNGEVLPSLLKDYFLGRGYRVVKHDGNQYILESVKKWEYFLTGKNSVSIEFDEKTLNVKMPGRYIYDIHHGFKFAKLFVKPS